MDEPQLPSIKLKIFAAAGLNVAGMLLFFTAGCVLFWIAWRHAKNINPD
jgi:hypothetical protein